VKVDIFDDKFSVGHLLLGIVSGADPRAAVAFIGYELVEHLYKNRKGSEESQTKFIGDIIEFFVGVGIGAMLQASQWLAWLTKALGALPS